MRQRRYFLPLAVSFSLVLFLGLWITYETLNSYSAEILEKRENGRLISQLTRIAVINAAKDGRITLERLKKLLSGIIDESDIRQITIMKGNTEIVRVSKGRKTLRSPLKTSFRQTLHIPLKIEEKNKALFIRKEKIKIWNSPFEIYCVPDKEKTTGNRGHRSNLLLTVAVLGFGLAVIFFIAWSVLIRNRNLEIKLKEARNRKEQSEQLSLTAAGLAHETKNPLGLIRGLAQQIKNNKNIVPEARKTAAEIMEQADITASRLGDFLSYAKERAPRFETVNAVAFIEKIINLINEDYSKAGIKIETDIDSVEITADREMLSQIMLNLLMNSLKFTGKGGTVKIIIKSRESGTSRLAVIDNGSGIPPDIIPDIFKPYVSRKSGGYGMGLAIVKRTVEQSGWSIEVKSIQDKGTKIFINGIKNAVYPGERK